MKSAFVCYNEKNIGRIQYNTNECFSLLNSAHFDR